MATDVISNLAGSLDAELEKARETLRSVDDDIKKVFGKDASELTVFGRNRRGGPQDGGNKEEIQHYNNDHFSQSNIGGGGGGGGGGRRRRDEDFDRDDEPNEKRRRGEDGRFGGGAGAFGGRLGPMATGNGSRFGGGGGGGGRRDSLEGGGGGGNNGDFAHYTQVGRRLASRVVSSGKDKSRDEVLAEQRQDSSGRDRNRRMFGALLGTLQRFKQDETKLKDKEDKRAQIEAKLDEAAKHEREVVKTKKQELIKERKIKLTEIKRIEVKRLRIAELEQWEEKTKFLSNFIRTEAKPHIFYLPKIMNPIMECRLEQSKQCVTEMISHKRKLVLEDLEDYEERSKRYWEGRVAGRSTGRRIDPMDADIEDELHEIMKSDDIDVDLPVDLDEGEGDGEDFTVTVFTNEPEDEKDSSSSPTKIKMESNGIQLKSNPDSSDDEEKGKENIMNDEPMDDEEERDIISTKVETAPADDSGDEDGEEITEETTIEVKDEEETEQDTMNTSDDVDRDVVPQTQEEEEEDEDSSVDQDEDEDA